MIYLRLAWSYLKIGLFGFGGGYAMLTLIEREIVGNGWLTPESFTDIVAISQMTPGPIGINSATYIGYSVGSASMATNAALPPALWGIIGALLCTLVVVIPSMMMVLWSFKFVSKHSDSVSIKGLFSGLRPVVPGLIAAAALLLINSENFGTADYEVIASVSICICTFLLARFTKIHPAILIVLAGVVGFFLF